MIDYLNLPTYEYGKGFIKMIHVINGSKHIFIMSVENKIMTNNTIMVFRKCANVLDINYIINYHMEFCELQPNLCSIEMVFNIDENVDITYSIKYWYDTDIDNIIVFDPQFETNI